MNNRHVSSSSISTTNNLSSTVHCDIRLLRTPCEDIRREIVPLFVKTGCRTLGFATVLELFLTSRASCGGRAGVYVTSWTSYLKKGAKASALAS
jgi:hypothetical protein